MTKLNLEIIEPWNISDTNRICIVDITPFRVGRDPENNWVIKDDLKRISRTHFIIEYINNVFTIIDMSSNGVILNAAQHPIGRGKSTLLSHGDVITLSGIKIKVEIVDAQNNNRIDQFLKLLPDRASIQQNYHNAEDVNSVSPQENIYGLNGADQEILQASDSLNRDIIVETTDRTLDTEGWATDLNFDRTPAELGRFDQNNSQVKGIPENWFDDENHETEIEDTQLKTESDVLKNNNNLLKLLLIQLAILEKTVSADENLLFSHEPEETLVRISTMDDQMVSYVIKTIFSQAIMKIENNQLRQSLNENNKINKHSLEKDSL